MFRQFHPLGYAQGESCFFVPAWAGERPSNQFFMSGRHGRRGSYSGGWGDEPRTRRGDIKFILLGLLSERPQHGYELMKELEARRGNFRRLSPGSVCLSNTSNAGRRWLFDQRAS